MTSEGKRLRYRLEWLGLVLASKLVPLLPRSVCLSLAKLLGGLASVIDREGRRVALANLEAAFGATVSQRERHRIMRSSFEHFARTMIELLWSPRLTRENFRHYIELENFEETERERVPPPSFIIVTIHYSNFEWFSHACAFSNFPGTIISQEFKNSELDPIFQNLRERSGHEFIPRDRAIVRLYKALRRNRSTAMLVDLSIPPQQGAVAIDCFGLKTSVTSAHAWLHQQTGAPIIPAHCEPLPNGRYRMVFHPRRKLDQAMTLQQIAQACWDSFEPYVRKNPAPWLWMYKHWRYKPREPDAAYPYYAQSWKPFDRILTAANEAPEGFLPGEAVDNVRR